MDKEFTRVTYKEIEDEMQKYHPDFKRLNVIDIAKESKTYEINSSLLDDHFTVLVRSSDKESILKAKEYLKSVGFKVFGSYDTYGIDAIRNDYILKGNFNIETINAVIEKVAKYSNIDLNNILDVGKNKEEDYYFYFYPIKEDVKTWTEFKQFNYLDKLNEFAKSSAKSIDLIFSQLDNVIYGGLKLPGIASDEFKDFYIEAINIQINKNDKRSLFITSKILTELVTGEEELTEYPIFQMLMYEDEPLFANYDIEEIYLDFPNEIDEKVFEEEFNN